MFIWTSILAYLRAVWLMEIWLDDMGQWDQEKLEKVIQEKHGKPENETKIVR